MLISHLQRRVAGPTLSHKLSHIKKRGSTCPSTARGSQKDLAPFLRTEENLSQTRHQNLSLTKGQTIFYLDLNLGVSSAYHRFFLTLYFMIVVLIIIVIFYYFYYYCLGLVDFLSITLSCPIVFSVFFLASIIFLKCVA